MLSNNQNGCLNGYPSEPHPRGEIHLHPTVGCYDDGTVPSPRGEYRYVVEGAGHERLSHHKTKAAAMQAAKNAAREVQGRLVVYDEGERVVEEKDYRRDSGPKFGVGQLEGAEMDVSLDDVFESGGGGMFR